MNGQVRITFKKDDFNKLAELTNQNRKSNNEEKRRKANEFFNKIMTYSYIKEELVVMNLYPSEARYMINLLNNNSNDVEISKNWFEELKIKKDEYKKRRDENDE